MTEIQSPVSELLARISDALPAGIEIYLVGGAVRDTLLGLPTHDLDFVLPEGAISVGRIVANALKGAFYILDKERDTARVILFEPEGNRKVLDFAVMRASGLEEDLRGRDFTINAIAIPLDRPNELIDPLQGAADLHTGVLRVCSETAFLDDPVRILRSVRLAIGFQLKLLPDTKRRIQQAVDQLPRVSPERIRDELFRILDGSNPALSIRLLDYFGALPFTLPELVATRGVDQSPPHIRDVWEHTLNSLSSFERVQNVLSLHYDPEQAANWAYGLISVRLGRYREQLDQHMQTALLPDRSLHALIHLGILYHDAGKPVVRKLDDDQRIRFFEHELHSEKMIGERGRWLRLSNQEVSRLEIFVRHHMRPLLLQQSGKMPSKRAIYRFFRDTGEVGVDICLFSLADTLATYGHTLPQDQWEHHVDLVRAMLEAWWENPTQQIAPATLLSGGELIDIFQLKPGPVIGELLESLREAQAVGEIQDRQQALAWVETRLKDRDR